MTDHLEARDAIARFGCPETHNDHSFLYFSWQEWADKLIAKLDGEGFKITRMVEKKRVPFMLDE